MSQQQEKNPLAASYTMPFAPAVASGEGSSNSTNIQHLNHHPGLINLPETASGQQPTVFVPSTPVIMPGQTPNNGGLLIGIGAQQQPYVLPSWTSVPYPIISSSSPAVMRSSKRRYRGCGYCCLWFLVWIVSLITFISLPWTGQLASPIISGERAMLTFDTLWTPQVTFGFQPSGPVKVFLMESEVYQTEWVSTSANLSFASLQRQNSIIKIDLPNNPEYTLEYQFFHLNRGGNLSLSYELPKLSAGRNPIFNFAVALVPFTFSWMSHLNNTNVGQVLYPIMISDVRRSRGESGVINMTAEADGTYMVIVSSTDRIPSSTPNPGYISITASTTTYPIADSVFSCAPTANTECQLFERQYNGSLLACSKPTFSKREPDCVVLPPQKKVFVVVVSDTQTSQGSLSPMHPSTEAKDSSRHALHVFSYYVRGNPWIYGPLRFVFNVLGWVTFISIFTTCCCGWSFIDAYLSVKAKFFPNGASRVRVQYQPLVGSEEEARLLEEEGNVPANDEESAQPPAYTESSI